MRASDGKGAFLLPCAFNPSAPSSPALHPLGHSAAAEANSNLAPGAEMP